MIKSYREYFHQAEPLVSELRTRVEDSLSRTVKQASWWWNTSAGFVSPPRGPATVTGPYVGVLSSMTDRVTPRFRMRSAQGEVINNPMSKTYVKLSASGGTMALRKVVNGITYGGDIDRHTNHNYSDWSAAVSSVHNMFSLYVQALDTETLIGLASTEARANVSMPSFTGLVSLGELSKTLRYLRNPFETGIKLARRLEQNLERVASGRNSRGGYLDDYASLYLEFRYGVRPLVKEVEQALTTMSEQKLPLPQRHTARARQMGKQVHTVNSASTRSGISFNERIDLTREYTVKCGLMYETIDAYDPLGTWGISLSDIPAAMWELTPLSFVFDWVVNVGDFISAMTPVGGIRHLANWTTIEDRHHALITESGYTFQDWSTASQIPSVIEIESVTKTRTPSVNYPSLEWKGFDKLSNDALRVLDLIGIFKQKLAPISFYAAKHEREVMNASRLDRRMNSYLAEETQRLLKVKKAVLKFSKPGF